MHILKPDKIQTQQGEVVTKSQVAVGSCGEDRQFSLRPRQLVGTQVQSIKQTRLMFLKMDQDTKLGEFETGVKSERREGGDKYDQNTL